MLGRAVTQLGRGHQHRDPRGTPCATEAAGAADRPRRRRHRALDRPGPVGRPAGRRRARSRAALGQAVRAARPHRPMPDGEYTVVLGARGDRRAARLPAGRRLHRRAGRGRYRPGRRPRPGARVGPGRDHRRRRRAGRRRAADRLRLRGRAQAAGAVLHRRAWSATRSPTWPSAARASAARRPGTRTSPASRSPAPEAANIVMAPGELSEDDLIAGVERGVYIAAVLVHPPGRPESRAPSPASPGTPASSSRTAASAGPVDAACASPSRVLGCLARVDGVGAALRTQPVMNVWNGAASRAGHPRPRLPVRRAPGPDDQEGAS